jgi:2-dehydropantoate 2-reductase
MNFAVFGAGGVGGYLGARLADAGHDVQLIARGDHLAAIRSSGLQVESVAGDTSVAPPATDDPAEIGPCDFVLVCVKSYDTREAASALAPLLCEETAVVSFQNGVDNERWLADEVGASRVVGGVAYIFSTVAEPGVVAHTGGPARFVFGELGGGQSRRVEALDDALSSCAGVEAVPAEDARVELWRKFCLICAQAGMTATTRLPLGEIRDTEASWAMYRRLMTEVATVARARGVDLPEAAVDEWCSFVRDLDPEMYSSLYHDLTHGNRLELDALHGSVVRHAADVGVDAPMNEAVDAILRPWATRRSA